MAQQIPAFIIKYFWDTAPQLLRLKEKKTYIIERLLEYGNKEVLNWLENTYSQDDIISVIRRSKILSRKSAIFYALYYDFNPNTILCLQKDFLNKHRLIWNY